MIENTSNFKSLDEYRNKVALSDKSINELDELTLQNKEAAKNTFYRYPRVEPDIIKASPKQGFMKPEVRTIEGKLTLDKIDEVTLYILCEFKFIPIWLMQQWYAIYDKNGYDTALAWIQFGLAWCEPTSLGVYIRPTMFLLNIIYDKDEGNKKFIGLPFNLMNHTCSEEQIMFDIMMGNPESEFWMAFMNEAGQYKLPCYHPLFVGGGDPTDTNGTIILAESLFRTSSWDPSEIIIGHENIAREMKTGAAVTSEFSDWRLFTLECGYNSKGLLETQRPDLAIPILRDNGKPRSFAIEMELTAKSMDRYRKIMEHYKNNTIYGCVVYFCGNNYIAETVRKAYSEAGGLGTCRLFVIPYSPPAQMLSSFSLDDLTSQYGLLKTTVLKTIEKEGNNEK